MNRANSIRTPSGIKGKRTSRRFGFAPLVTIAMFVAAGSGVHRTAAQDATIHVRVRADQPTGDFKPVWAYFGYDEPNYTYAEHGEKLLRELAASTPVPVRIRTHNLLTSGDGTPALKWGSTNAYTEDAAGKPVYDWKILDRIFDTYRDARVTPFVEIGFMPRALSTHPEAYQHQWPKGPLWTGWAYPPKDYVRWGELVRQWVRHSAERYGRAEAASWYWEVWNEPDIGYWQGTPEEYFKLYDYTAQAVKSELPEARVGGPATTGPANPRAADFLRKFLAHCESGQNFASGKTGAPLDFISFHAKGATRYTGGHVEMNAGRQLRDIAAGFQIVAGSAKFHDLPVVLSESDPEGCAACDAVTHPENGYRNTSQYAGYEAEILKAALELAARFKINLAGSLTWAFEFEDQPLFAGFRSLATGGIDLPVLNVFRMFGLMGGESVAATSSAALPLDSVLQSSVRADSDVNVLATRTGDAVKVLVWNFHDEDASAPDATVDLSVEGLPEGVGRVLVEHYRIDSATSNAYTAWKAIGSPQQPTAEQLGRLKAAGQLHLWSSPGRVEVRAGSVHWEFPLSRQAISFFRLRWPAR